MNQAITITHLPYIVGIHQSIDGTDTAARIFDVWKATALLYTYNHAHIQQTQLQACSLHFGCCEVTFVGVTCHTRISFLKASFVNDEGFGNSALLELRGANTENNAKVLLTIRGTPQPDAQCFGSYLYN